MFFFSLTADISAHIWVTWEHLRESFSLEIYLGTIWTIWVKREFNSQLNRAPPIHRTHFWKKHFLGLQIYVHIDVCSWNVEERVLVSRYILDGYNLYGSIENLILNSLDYLRSTGLTFEKMFFFSQTADICPHIWVTWERLRERCSLRLYFWWIWTIWVETEFNSQLIRPPPMHRTHFWRKKFSLTADISPHICVPLERLRESFSDQIYFGSILIIWFDREFNSQLNRLPPFHRTHFRKKCFFFLRLLIYLHIYGSPENI
jgi:hypothetical protein